MTTYTPANVRPMSASLAQVLAGIRAVLSLGASMNQTWQEQPRRRVAILTGIAVYWSILWLGAVVILLILPVLRPWFALVTALLILGFAAAVYGAAGGREPARRMALAALVMPGLWLLSVSAALYLAGDVILTQYPIPYLLSGWVLIGMMWIMSLYLPLWGARVRHTEVYIIEHPGMQPEEFTLWTRPIPVIRPELAASLEQAGIPPDILQGFLRYNGPQHIRRQFAQRVPPQSAHLLSALYEVVDRQAPMAPILWMSAVDRIRLFWDMQASVNVDTAVREVVTQGGHLVDLRLRFAARFDPLAVRDTEFYMGLPGLTSRADVQNTVVQILTRGAESLARRTFITVPWEAALAEAAVERFRQVLIEQMLWTLNLGVAVMPFTVQCNPVYTQRVLEAEDAMRAARAEAHTQTSRVNLLVDRVMRQGIPRELLTALMFIDQGERLTLQWPGSGPLFSQETQRAGWPDHVDLPASPTIASPQPPPLVASSAQTISIDTPSEQTIVHAGGGMAEDTPEDWTQSGSDYNLRGLVTRPRDKVEPGQNPNDSPSQ